MKGKRDLSDYSDAVDELAQWVCEASNEDTDDEVVRLAMFSRMALNEILASALPKISVLG